MEKLVIVESLEGKFGPQLKSVDGSFYSFSKFYTGQKAFPAGTVLDVDVYTTSKGGRYLNKAIIVPQEAVKEAPKAEKKAVSKPVEATKPAKTSEVMTKADWGAKDRSQLIGGLSHDAAALAAVMANVNSLDAKGALAVYRELLEGMLLIREQVK